ncbi:MULTISPECIES: homoserine dehydrogenase [Geobacillus]|jgi:homoserine dehydrogenase|uniref:Homoserine dehydrogenase n=2 Tax=Geobacillus thermodenitrificans TaxID=33940 RepID=A4ISF5_GEOTN|nr:MULTISPECIES: homoserine dehydrogenase [Geobacillus]ABO68259.1 Homoserine dehydrogenase [Geobacillus thermodenitrificans NG80-2]ARP43976.1 Homoserine dehydrogenase [Geobacillus thermodenitrificans]ATO37990.1 homoserine dehydrogenase [Geobacillus thermodenitrificans]KQB91845.1 Homoserine dehydrogenase [Geobacillus sp. PA-3]MED4917691.1 homoserine dehydrogenase [Geobacillus thermodenitrificans]
MEKPIFVGLLGLGTVGSGVVKIIENHQEKLIHQVGCPVKVKKILVRDVQKPREVAVDSALLTTSAADVIDDPDIDVIIEVMGGIEETKELLLRALRQGKHVVTANKDLMAVYGSELLRVAAEHHCDLFYEASVAGGIPILRSLVDGLASDRITKMMGIVNGTTNYILTKMSQNGASYQEVLAEAQALGFAEADPTSDVEGLDAARKMAILARLGFSMDIDLDDVQVKGITHVTEEDLNYGKRLGYTMKLIGIAQRNGNKVEVSVQPTFLPDSHPLASVHNEYNAVYVYGEAVGETMFYGPGAGSLPTATAVVSDLVAVMKNMRLGVNGHYAVAPQYEKQLKAPAEIFSKYFLRIHVKDQVGAFAKITTLFSERGVSFEKILQLPLKENGLAEIVIVTHDASQQDYEDILQQLSDLEIVERVQSSYRVEGEKR